MHTTISLLGLHQSNVSCLLGNICFSGNSGQLPVHPYKISENSKGSPVNVCLSIMYTLKLRDC